MSPQAVRLSSSRQRMPQLPSRTYAVLLGAALVLILLGRLLLRLAILLAIGVAAMLWFTPEIAYWLDETLWLHRVPAFGGNHRQMAVATFGFLGLAALLGSLSTAGQGQIPEQNGNLS